MTINEGGWDRGARIVVGLILLWLGWGNVVTGGLGTVLKIVGFLPLLTGIIGVCPAYLPFGLNTCSLKNRKPGPGAGPA